MPLIGPSKIASRFPGYLFCATFALAHVWDRLFYHRHWASFCQEAQSFHPSVRTTQWVIADLAILAVLCSLSLTALYFICKWASDAIAGTDPKVARFVYLSGAFLVGAVLGIIVLEAVVNIVRVYAYGLGEQGHLLPSYLPWQRHLTIAIFYVLIVAASAALGCSRLHYKNYAFWSLVYSALAIAMSYSRGEYLDYYGTSIFLFVAALSLQVHILKANPRPTDEHC